MELHIKRFSELTTDELYAIVKARIQVFIVDQNCPYIELDGRDQRSIHVWLEEDGELLAYLRVMEKGLESEYVSIGRVLSTRRRQGLATQALREGIRAARDFFGPEKIYLEAQVYARGLYDKLGFRQISEEFLLDGIPHIKMLLD